MLRVTPVECLSDNYAYLVHRQGSSEAVVVDPGEASPVVERLRSEGLRLVGILNTHHHHDHVGGNSALIRQLGGVPVYGHRSERGRIPAQDRFLEQGDRVELAGLSFEVLHVPGHTRGALAYLVADCAFTGDTLLVAGCGRLFEGTPAEMYSSLNHKLGTLPANTRLFCGHEYSEKNLQFAAAIEPGNAAIRAKAASVRELRALGEPSVPSTLGAERETNPFLRCSVPAVVEGLASRLRGETCPVAVLAAARAAKDVF